MRLTLILLTLLAANPAFAHIGHLGEVAGHGHWVAAGAIGIIAIALGIAAIGARKGKKHEDDAIEDEPSDEEEVPA